MLLIDHTLHLGMVFAEETNENRSDSADRPARFGPLARASGAPMHDQQEYGQPRALPNLRACGNDR
jgi:hypothetical protein